ncbi:SDR family oxidoreductase [Methanosarcina sp.]|uniref:SDR family oxidoreductase n=1 Tax=Methanosarcina sp. TaxID=2213 RepID=UPI0029894893|nr:SDR family oxidoreductase [Methanosarcina sp.]MDW5549230.1 SDR family oxidoreductase [Methanosarcina sp.]MDW5553066.1 SDR family oxidoreductase [Methanosarcina sp.]MDW5559409.1 SDR family oxidoreductase [Methanosarcina sp.]
MEEAIFSKLKKKSRKENCNRIPNFRIIVSRRNFLNNKNVVVTGGMGFIGSHLAERLLEDNEVTIIDNESTGKIENIRHLLDHKNLTVIKDSIVDLDLTEIFKDKDYVFHLAAIPSVPRSVKDPFNSNNSNVTGTLNVLIAARDAGVKKVVFSSSSSVYGDTPTLPKREDMPINPMSPYAITKATGEMYCKVFQDLYNLPTVSLRYFNVFGPRQDPNSQYAAVIPKFITAILNDESPVIYGDGEQSRDFTFVKNVVDANILSCESKKTGVFNIACGRRITINQLADYINEILGKEIKPVHAEPRPGDIKHSLADISRAKEFGYNPEDNFKDELEKVVQWFTK